MRERSLSTIEVKSEEGDRDGGNLRTMHRE